MDEFVFPLAAVATTGQRGVTRTGKLGGIGTTTDRLHRSSGNHLLALPYPLLQ